MRNHTMPFAGALMDHDEGHRTPQLLKPIIDEPGSRLVVFHDGHPAVGADNRLMTAHPRDIVGLKMFDPGVAYLGRHAGTGWFAVSLSTFEGLREPEDFKDVRQVASRMPADELAIAGRASSLLAWHKSHRFCPACGHEAAPSRGGLFRHCRTCQIDHYPRINPVVIMLIVTPGNDRVLLGRAANWPQGAYSALAGFVSPGESLEEAAIREVQEEAGIRIGDVSYVASQPWPFPGQMMVGMRGVAETTDVTIDPKEIEDAKWFTRDEVAAVFAKTGSAFVRPPRFTIAHQLLRHWLET